jgi:hypothetical protein
MLKENEKKLCIACLLASSLILSFGAFGMLIFSTPFVNEVYNYQPVISGF